MLHIIIIVISFALLAVIATSWGSRSIRGYIAKVALVAALLIVNILLKDLLFSIIWGISLVLYVSFLIIDR